MSFKVGDLCVIVKSVKRERSPNEREGAGNECEIIDLERDVFCTDGKIWFGFQVRFPNGVYGIQPRETLRLKRPPTEYDGNQAGSWDLIPWQPRRERVENV